jgi:hypothetical protein
MYDTPGFINSEKVRLITVLRTSTLSYVYDFGDYWDHRITVEKSHTADPRLTLPFCVGGRAPRHPRTVTACPVMPTSCGPWPIPMILNTNTLPSGLVSKPGIQQHSSVSRPTTA